MDLTSGEMYPEWSPEGEDVGNPGILPFFDEDRWFAGEPPRRIRGARIGPPPVRPSPTGDRQKPPQEPKIDLVLYTSPESEKSRRAERAVRDVLKGYDASQVRFTMCDLSQRPQDGDADSVVFTPTLVKQGPGPKTSIIGNLERAEILCDLLDASGVDRRWDD